MAFRQNSIITVSSAATFHPPRQSFSMASLGLELAQLADLPSDVLVEASRVADRLTELEADRREDSESSRLALRRKAMLRVSVAPYYLLSDEHLHHTRARRKLQSQLTQCLEYSNLPNQELITYVGRFQKDIARILRSGLLPEVLAPLTNK